MTVLSPVSAPDSGMVSARVHLLQAAGVLQQILLGANQHDLILICH